MIFELPPLPYPKDALKPYISEETINYHYGKHHQGYVIKLNKLLEDKPQEQNKSLVELIKTTSGDIFNNASQVWNHTFYWKCLTNKKKQIDKVLQDAIIANFGSIDKFKEEFKKQALGNFGSGWTWLVKDKNKKLKIVNTQNAQNPMVNDLYPLLTCDVWEHAYYIDYRNDRGKYLDNFWLIVNWDFVKENYQH